ncbi:hypothetical protein Tco_1384011 [Tanacetum coccineum]
MFLSESLASLLKSTEVEIVKTDGCPNQLFSFDAWNREQIRDVLTLGCHLEKIHVTWAHLEKKQTRLRTCTKIHQEVLFSECRNGIAGIKRRRRDLSGDGVLILATVSQPS